MFVRLYYDDVFKTNAFEKQNSKVWKIITLGFKDFCILSN
jgi:hypothetical protein